MDSYLNRNRSRAWLGTLLFAQLLLLGYQVRRPDAGGVRLVRLWGVQSIIPAEKVSQHVVEQGRNLVHGYIALRQVNRQNQELRAQLARLELDNQRLRESAREIPRLDALLGFQRSYGMQTQAAQVISSGASADTQTIYLDRGAAAGLARNMAVITPDGVVGKLSQVLNASAQVLLVTDPESGAGALVGAARVHGVMHGLGPGRAELLDVLRDEPVAVGDAVITSGEDQVYPKGIPLGTVSQVSPGPVFQAVQVKLAADLSRLEEVLVITGRLPAASEPLDAGQTAAEIRQAQLPSLPPPAAGVASAATLARGGAASNAPATATTEVPFPIHPGDPPPAEGDALGAPLPAVALPAPSATPAAAKPQPPASHSGGH